MLGGKQKQKTLHTEEEEKLPWISIQRNATLVYGIHILFIHLFIQSVVDVHLGCIHFLTTVNSAVVNVGLYIF